MAWELTRFLITMFTSFDTKNRTNYDRKFINKKW